MVDLLPREERIHKCALALLLAAGAQAATIWTFYQGVEGWTGSTEPGLSGVPVTWNPGGWTEQFGIVQHVGGGDFAFIPPNRAGNGEQFVPYRFDIRADIVPSTHPDLPENYIPNDMVFVRVLANGDPDGQLGPTQTFRVGTGWNRMEFTAWCPGDRATAYRL